MRTTWIIITLLVVITVLLGFIIGLQCKNSHEKMALLTSTESNISTVDLKEALKGLGINVKADGIVNMDQITLGGVGGVTINKTGVSVGPNLSLDPVKGIDADGTTIPLGGSNHRESIRGRIFWLCDGASSNYYRERCSKYRSQGNIY